MKEKKTNPEKTIVIDIKPTRGLIVALSCVLTIVALLAYLTLTGERAAASDTGTSGETSLAQSTGMRQFYLTKSLFLGDQALAACAPGYHMASLWEMPDPSKLKYNIALGVNRDDSGQGPPAEWYGWVRTGYAFDESYTTGRANCASWTSSSSDENGSYAKLPFVWTAGWQDVGVWDTWRAPCDFAMRVWCIED